jgi:hypothetical protein
MGRATGILGITETNYLLRMRTGGRSFKKILLKEGYL